MVIFRDDGLRAEDLQTVLDELQAAEDLAAMLPRDALQALSQLEQEE